MESRRAGPGLSLGVWGGLTSTSGADSLLAPGLSVRVDHGLGPGRIGLELGYLPVSGNLEADVGDELAAELGRSPARSEHLLATYELLPGERFHVRAGLGFARHRFRVLDTNSGRTRVSSEVGAALAVAAGLEVARMGGAPLSVDAVLRHSGGEDSTGSRTFVGIGLTLRLR